MKLQLFVSALVASIGAAAFEPVQARQSKTGYRTIQLVSFECGDNCYVVYRFSGGKDQRALCRAKVCDSWERAQALPKALAGKTVQARFGQAAQYDGAGNMMSTNFPSVETLVLP